VSPPPHGEAGAIQRARDQLDAIGFNGAGVREALASGEDMLSRARDIPVQVRRLRDAGPLGVAIRLFILDLSVPRDDIARALAPLSLEAFASLGLLRIAGDEVSPLVRIVPHDDFLVASDVRLRAGQGAAHDHLPGVHRPSVTLAHLTVRRPVETALDLATGCGIEALLLSAHSKHVLATDVNERAVAYADFNAKLNRLTNCEFRAGSWFDPVGSSRFDTLVCNPPYVISPETQYVYRDSGMPGDSVSEQVVRQIPAHLNYGGFATVMVSWVARDADDDVAPVKRWVEGSGCDAWILHYRTEDPLAAARTWNEADATDPVEYARTIDRWLAYFAEQDIPAIAYGTVILRRRDATRNWVRVDPMPQGRLRPASDQILRVFAAQEHLGRISSDEALLEERFAIAERHSIEERARIGGSGRETVSIQLSLEEGLGFQASVDPYTLRLLEKLGGRTLRQAFIDAANSLEVAPDARGRFVQGGLGVIRQMYATGFLDRVND